MSQKLMNVALFVIAAVSVLTSYAGFNDGLAVDSLWWKLLFASVATATGVAIFTFWKAAYEAVIHPVQIRFRSVAWIATLIGCLFVFGMSSWWSTAGIGGNEAKNAALYATVQQSEQALARSVKQNTAYRGFLSRLEGLSGNVFTLEACEDNTGCVTGSPGKKGVYQTLKQMRTKLDNIIASVKSADAKLVARFNSGKKCLSEMREVLTAKTSVDARANGVSTSVDCVNAAVADISSYNQLERIAQEMENLTVGLVLPVSIKTDKQRQAVSNIFGGIAKQAGAIASDARKTIKPVSVNPVSVPRMSAMKAVVIYYDSILPAWITAISLDWLPLILLLLKGALAGSKRSRPDSPARDWTIKDLIEVRDLGRLLLEDQRPRNLDPTLLPEVKPGVIISPVNRITYKSEDGEVPDYWFEDVEIKREDDDKELMSRLKPGVDHLVGAIAALTVILFIGADIIVATGWNWRSWLQSIRDELVPHADNREVRNYVEFITTKHDGLKITTGIRFGSSQTGKITGQWCYVEPARERPGKVFHHLPLATKDGTGPEKPNLFTSENLRPFNLTEAQAKALITNQCRFKQ